MAIAGVFDFGFDLTFSETIEDKAPATFRFLDGGTPPFSLSLSSNLSVDAFSPFPADTNWIFRFFSKSTFLLIFNGGMSLNFIPFSMPLFNTGKFSFSIAIISDPCTSRISSRHLFAAGAL